MKKSSMRVNLSLCELTGIIRPTASPVDDGSEPPERPRPFRLCCCKGNHDVVVRPPPHQSRSLRLGIWRLRCARSAPHSATPLRHTRLTRLELAREAGPDRHEGHQVERRREQPHRRLKRTVRCRFALCCEQLPSPSVHVGLRCRFCCELGPANGTALLLSPRCVGPRLASWPSSLRW